MGLKCGTVQEINSRFTQQLNVVFCVYADLCSLLAATGHFSTLIGQNMQLTGCRNEMRNATCVNTQISIEWPYCSFLYCDKGLTKSQCNNIEKIQKRALRIIYSERDYDKLLWLAGIKSVYE